MTEGNNKWFALRFFNIKVDDVEEHLKEDGFTFFYPEKPFVIHRKGEDKEVNRPVLRNMIFVKEKQLDTTAKEILEGFKTTPLENKFYVLKYHPESEIYAKISNKEMREFMMLCNPAANLNYFLTPLPENKLKKGSKVVVTRGPLKGMVGRLERRSKRYFLVKDIMGMGLMIQVAKWTCRAVDENSRGLPDSEMTPSWAGESDADPE